MRSSVNKVGWHLPRVGGCLIRRAACVAICLDRHQFVRHNASGSRSIGLSGTRIGGHGASISSSSGSSLRFSSKNRVTVSASHASFLGGFSVHRVGGRPYSRAAYRPSRQTGSSAKAAVAPLAVVGVVSQHSHVVPLLPASSANLIVASPGRLAVSQCYARSNTQIFWVENELATLHRSFWLVSTQRSVEALIAACVHFRRRASLCSVGLGELACRLRGRRSTDRRVEHRKRYVVGSLEISL